MKFDPRATFKPSSLLIALSISLMGGLIYERGAGMLRIGIFTILFFVALESLVAIKLLLSDTR